MPIYEYQCQSCGKTTEVIQKFSDAPLETCEFCSGKLAKLISQSSFHLKGSGWYVTDYAKNPKDNTTTEKTESKASEKSKAPEKSKTPEKGSTEKKPKESAT